MNLERSLKTHRKLVPSCLIRFTDVHGNIIIVDSSNILIAKPSNEMGSINIQLVHDHRACYEISKEEYESMVEEIFGEV